MSRLFWKFFLFLLLAQLTTVVGVSVAIWAEHRQEAALRIGLDFSPPAQSNIENALATLQKNGKDSLIALLRKRQNQATPQVFVVDNLGHELLARPYNKNSFDLADEYAGTTKFGQISQRVKMSNGQSFLVFVPNTTNSPTHDAPPEFNTPPGSKEGFAPPPGPSAAMPPPPNMMGTHPHDHPPKFPLIPLLGGSLVSFIFALLLARYFSKPINNLRSAFQQASSGKLDTRVAHLMQGRRDELSDLGRDFDTMATRLESLIQSQTKLLHHVSHELRSPLARMQMALGLVKQSPNKIQAFLDRVELETNRIDKLVGELLELSRLDSGVIQVQKENLDINQLIHSIVEDAKFEASQKNIQLHLNLGQNCEFKGQPDLLYRAIENVVRNAIKYGGDEGEVRIASAYHDADQSIHISVTDNGDGVDESELEDIFKPFIRGLSGSQTSGHGVGLAITKQVLEAHGGIVFAKNLKPKGFCIEMVLPCK